MKELRTNRITISLRDKDYQVLKRLNELNGVPMAKTVSELVELVTPMLDKIADNLAKIKLADENIRMGLLASTESGLAAITELQNQAMERYDMFSDELSQVLDGLVDAAKYKKQDKSSKGFQEELEQGKTPRVVTRGSGSQKLN